MNLSSKCIPFNRSTPETETILFTRNLTSALKAQEPNITKSEVRLFRRRFLNKIWKIIKKNWKNNKWTKNQSNEKVGQTKTPREILKITRLPESWRSLRSILMKTLSKDSSAKRFNSILQTKITLLAQKFPKINIEKKEVWKGCSNLTRARLSWSSTYRRKFKV